MLRKPRPQVGKSPMPAKKPVPPTKPVQQDVPINNIPENENND
jgi:hypothetical protein